MSGIEYHYTDSSALELILNSGDERHYPWHLHAGHGTVGLVLAGVVTLGTKNADHSLRQGETFLVRPCEVHRLSIAAGSSLATLCLSPTEVPADISHHLAARLSSCDAARLEELGNAVTDTRQTDKTPLTPIIQRLVTEPEESFSLAQMASLAGYSPWYFLRCFQKETGLTPHAFQLVCRLRQARLLLRKKIAAAEAAVSAGFADQSHLHKVFKRHHGLTPRQFLQASFRLARQ